MIPTTIHMGLPKTGSSSMQQFFHKNRELLKKHGILYPSSLGKTAHRKLLVLAGSKGYERFDESYVHTNARACHDAVVKELRQELTENCPERVILSCENMPSVQASTYGKLRRSLESCGLRVDEILLYLRPQADWRRSVIQQRIKTGIWSDENLYPVDPPESCGIYGCFRNHIERRAAAFSLETIKARLFGTPYFKDGNFFSEIQDAFALPVASYKKTPPVNESLSDFACQMLLHLNKSMPRYKADGRPCKWRGSIKRAAVKYLKASKGPLAKAPLSIEDLEHYDKYYQESNEWTRQRYFPEKTRLFDLCTAPSKIAPDLEDQIARARKAAVDVQGIDGDAAIDRFFLELRNELIASAGSGQNS